MKHFRLAFIGFGNVGKALGRLFLQKKDELQNQQNITFSVTGVATAKHGTAIDLDGLKLTDVLQAHNLDDLSKLKKPASMIDFVSHCGADILFENSPVNYETGQPAVDHLKAALELGMHAITANKGPVVHAYRTLSDLAASKNRKFYFESTVMDGAPVFSLFREALPGANLISFRGVLNSTTNMILTRMENGDSFDRAVQYCQEIGIAETDPSGDIDGWDAAVKVAALTTVLMGIPLKPHEVDRQGIRQISNVEIEHARNEGKRWKLICSARRTGSREVEAIVKPEMVTATSPLFNVSGTTSIVEFETDVLGLLSIVESDPGPHTTAYGLYADFLNAIKH